MSSYPTTTCCENSTSSGRLYNRNLRRRYKRRQPSPSGRNSWDEESTFLSEMKNHLFQLEGFSVGHVLVSYLIFNLMPETYYDLDQPVKFLDVLLQLLVVDFFQTIMHFGEHYVANFYIKAISLTTYLSPLVCLMLSMVRLWTPSA